MNFSTFINEQFLPHTRATLAASSQASYRLACTSLQRVFGALELSELTVPIGISGFAEISRLNPRLGHRSLQHLRAILSAVITHAIRLGLLPLTSGTLTKYIVLPKRGNTRVQHAYTLPQVQAILATLTGLPRVAVALAAYAGLRSAEISGLMWQDWRDDCLYIERAVWRGIVGRTKNQASCAPVPVIAPLAAILEQWKQETGGNGYMLASAVGGSIRIDRLAQASVRPAVEKIPLPWTGVHAFRRSCATLLYQAGIPDLTIARILRHGSVETTRRCYIKSTSADLRAAMEALQ
jgi:integrase